MRPTTLTLIDVDEEAEVAELAREAARARNVALVLEDPALEAEERTREAWRDIERTHSRFVLTDADPLRGLVEAYVEGWSRERLDVFDVAALVTPATALPDFYVLLDAGEPDADAHGRRFLVRDWFLSVVRELAPARVLPVVRGESAGTTAGRILHQIATLPMGAPLPPPQELVERARRRVPGQA